MRGLQLLRLSVLSLVALAAVPRGATPADTGDAAEDRPFGDRPRVGLVLGGGGAKGGAHVGVIKVLEELRVPVDCIAGTSMGALIGGGYAAGLSAEALERFIASIDWSEVVGGAGRRSDEPIEQKRLAAAASTSIELGVRDGRVTTPGGFVDTSAIDDLLRRFVATGRNATNFDDLPIPFRAVATDMVGGAIVVLDHGDLATAMRASMAIPGAFAPVVGGGRVLADGGMVRNVPVDVARQTCADVVIVVNLRTPRTPPEKLVEAGQLLVRSMDVMLQMNVAAQLDTLTGRDVRIDVQMGDITTADFHRTAEAIPLGEKAARAVAERLAAYAVPEAEYMSWRRRVTTEQKIEVQLADVRFEGLTWVDPEYLRTKARLREGDFADLEAISADARRMAALEEIDSVAYRLEGGDEAPTLVWTPGEASVGPDVLRPSLGMYAAGGGDLKFQLGVQYVQRWLNRRGAQWRNTVEIGYESSLATSLYQPLGVPQRWFVEPTLAIARTAEDVYNDGRRVATYRFVDLGGRLDFGWNINRNTQLRTGYWADKRSAQPQTGVRLLPEFDAWDGGFAATALYDSRNDPSFATQGLGAQLEYFKVDESLGADRNWERIEAGLHLAIPLRHNVMWLGAAGGAGLGDDLPADRTFSLGGARTLPAYQYDELRARKYWLVSANMLWRLIELAPVQRQALYAGVGLQAAGIYDRIDPVEDDQVYGLSAYFGGPTPLGTFSVGAGFSQSSWAIWLAIGRPIGKGSILESALLR